ncbi:class I SAM-dependent methyltransferase [Candidatus Fermentibacteria bacterium]|nr:class I SAM-dependent methyltransferase [Candidatus Fermentibacteria bacterium]
MSTISPSRPCNLCGESTATLVHEGRDRMHPREGTYHLLRCSNCGLIFLDPLPPPEEIATFYPQEYTCFSPAQSRGRFRGLEARRGIRRLCRAVTGVAPHPGRILDVGCGTGDFLAGMRDLGWDVQGVEPNSHAAGYARTVNRLRVEERPFADGLFAPESFDVVTLWHVLEHVPDPAQTLGATARLLRRGGSAVITVPNVESWDARLFGPHWAGLDVPRHLFLFPREVLRRYLEEAHLVYTRDACVTGGTGGLITSLRFWTAAWPGPRGLRGAATQLIGSLPIRLVAWPYGLAGRLTTRGSFITVFARRP